MVSLEEAGTHPCNRALISPTELRSLPPGRLSLLDGLAHGWISRPRHAKQVLLLEVRQQPRPVRMIRVQKHSRMGNYRCHFPHAVNNKA